MYKRFTNITIPTWQRTLVFLLEKQTAGVEVYHQMLVRSFVSSFSQQLHVANSLAAAGAIRLKKRGRLVVYELTKDGVELARACVVVESFMNKAKKYIKK